MKKRFLAIAKKAMVWTMAASMLVATPMTASAQGLSDVFKIEDQWGNNVDENGNKTDVIHGNNSATGTVTSTYTRSAVLDNEASILGISLSTTSVELELDGAYDAKKENDALKNGQLTDGNALLEVSILTNKELSEAEFEKLFKSLTWKSSDTSVVAFKNFKDGTAHDKLLSAKAGGDATITVSLDNHENDIHFTATADVHVKQYASEVKFEFPANRIKEGKPIGYLKHTVDLDEILVKTPETANDDIIFEIVEQKDASGKEKNSGIAAIKDTRLTYQKIGSIKVVAIPEKAKRAETEITIDEGKPATKVEIKEKGASATAKKKNLQADTEGVNLELEAVLYTKESGKSPITNRDACTDDIVWSSKKPAIVDIVGSSKGDTVKLVAKGVGSSAITATASAGKKGTFTVTVKADMTGIEIVPNQNGDLYGGQSYELEANTKFGKAPDNFDPKAALKWEIDKANSTDNGKYGKVKGNVLTLATTVKVGGKVTVTVKSAKKYKGSNIVPASNPKNVEFTMKQADVRKIVVSEGTTAKADTSNKKLKGVVTIAAGKDKTLNVVAYGPNNETTIIDDGKDTGIALASTLNWVSGSTKIATVKRGTDTGRVFANKEKAGNSTITVSGTSKKSETKYVALKTTFKTTVTKPAEWIKISTKTNAIAATGKKQTVKYIVTLPKGTTSKAANVDWLVYQAKLSTNSEGKVVVTKTKLDASKVKKGAITLDAGSYNAGEWLEVTATSKDKDDKSSVTASATIAIVTPSVALRICDKDGTEIKNTTLDTENPIEIKPQINVGTKQAPNWVDPRSTADGVVASGVTYSVNKKGVVFITTANGKVQVYRIKKGTVKLTVSSADGKKAVLTIKD